MNKFIEKLFPFIMLLKHDKNNKSSYSYSIGGNKTVMSGNEFMTFTAKNDEIKAQIRSEIEKIYKEYKNNPQPYLDYICEHGTPVFRQKYADKILSFLGEDEGVIFGLSGIKALILSVFAGQGFSLNTKTMFMLRSGIIEPLSLLHNFYRWYSWYKKMPGFDSRSQYLFKRYMKFPNADLSGLKQEDIISLQEAVARDKEATEFCLFIARETEGAKNVQKKMNEEGGANI